MSYAARNKSAGGNEGGAPSIEELESELTRALAEAFEREEAPAPAAGSGAAGEGAQNHDAFAEEMDRLLETPDPDSNQSFAPAASGGSGAPTAPTAPADPIDEFGTIPPMAQPSLDGSDFSPLSSSSVMAGGKRGRFRFGFAIPGALFVLALVGVSAFFYWRFSAPPPEVPVLLADTQPVRQKPKEAGGEVIPNQDQTVYQTVQGVSADTRQQARLNDNTETPIKLSQGQEQEQGQRQEAQGAQEAQSEPEEEQTLRPNIVATIAADAQGNLAAAPATGSDESGQSIQSVLEAESETASGETVQAQSETVESEIVQTETPAADETISGGTAESAPQTQTQTQTQTAEAEPQEPENSESANAAAIQSAPEPQAEPEVSYPYAVQISARRSNEAAEEAWRKLSRRYAALLEGREFDIRRVEIDGRGTFYRVRVPSPSLEEAQNLCAGLKQAGGDCLVRR